MRCLEVWKCSARRTLLRPGTGPGDGRTPGESFQELSISRIIRLLFQILIVLVLIASERVLSIEGMKKCTLPHHAMK
jgi:hypothetical protein